MTSRHARGAVALVLLLSVATAATAAGRYEPRLRFRMLKTPHFSIYFHQGEEALASRLAAIAEESRLQLSIRMGLSAPLHTHVILVDQTDVSNGWATPIPFDTIEISAVPPLPSSYLGNVDDWLRLVFTHEYAHILYLDQSGGLMRALRVVFGRTPPAFPNLYLPLWQIEGFATYAESAVTGRGRIHAGDFAGIMTEAARAGRFASIEAVGGGMVQWPSGIGPYLYGGFFTKFLADRDGEQALGELARRTARRLPLLGGGAFRQVFGKSAPESWRDFEAVQVSSAARPASVTTTIRRLTTHGHFVSGPRFVGKRGDDGGEAIWYSRQSPDEFPAVYQVGLEGQSPVRVGDRYYGDGLSASRRWAYYDQLEVNGAVSLLSDLYARHLASGRTWRLTTGRRLSSPDVSPDASRIAAVVVEAGRRAIVILPVREPSAPDRPPVVDLRPLLTIGAPAAQYLSPRWSPDGSALVAARQGLDGSSDIVLIDAQTGAVTPLVRSHGARNVTPSWTPDGRFVLFASAKTGEPFQIFRVPVQAGNLAGGGVVSLVLRTEGGALSPEVTADGRTVAFVGLTDRGYDLFAAPLPSANSCEDAVFESEASQETETLPSQLAEASAVPTGGPAASAYSPWATLAPRAWEPRVESDGTLWKAGAAVAGGDVLGYHSYLADILWPISRIADLGPGNTRRRPDWSVSYVYDRWRPSLFASASQSVTPLFDQILARGRAPEDLEEQSREIAVGVQFAWRHVRYGHNLLASIDLVESTLRSRSNSWVSSRNAIRLGWSLSTARVFGYSVSPEGGVSARVTYEAVSPSLGADGAARAGTADLRLYLPGGIPHAVIALRVAGGASSGDALVSRVFSLGGNQAPSRYDFGRHGLGLLRGFAEDFVAGSRIAMLNLDFRVPVVRVERGSGTRPVFFNTLHAATFVDVGDAWVERVSWRDVKTSVGAELALDLTLGYTYAVTFATGAAWTRDPSGGRTHNGPAVFVRLGRAF
jgi:hypothetical protein